MLQLNEGQLAAAQQFIGFLLSNQKEFVISGQAGVGKTTLLKHLMELQEAEGIAAVLGTTILSEWSLTATTNKAAEVLQVATGFPATTIHQLLGLIVRNDYENGSSKISRKPNSEVIGNRVIVVDECSMVDTQLRKYIEECTINCKIVYVGDHCQLAPVGEPISPVFRDNNTVELTQIVRSQGAPPITRLCQQLRQTVETGIFMPIKGEPGTIDYLSPEEAQREICATFVDDLHADARILCYTNNKVLRFNQFLRDQRGLPSHFVPGEWVVSNGMCYSTAGKKAAVRLRVEEEIEIISVEDVQPFPFFMQNKRYELPIYEVTCTKGSFRVAKDVNDWQGLIKEAGKLKQWPTYFELKEQIADLRPRDACTVYKAQGSTYRDVFVDLSDIGTCTNPSQAARMLYVANSRPTNRICFIGQLPKRFLGEES